MKKPRSDSKLKNLTAARQEQIMAWCKESGYEHARKQLAADGLRVSVRALGEFYSWYQLRADFAAAEQSAATATELMREFDPTDAEKAEAFGQFVFTQAAIASKDTKKFVDLQYLALSQKTAKTKAVNDRAKLALAREKFEVQTCERFLKWFSDHKARDIAESKLSNAQKIAALRAEYFADVDELEAAGTVVLPERS